MKKIIQNLFVVVNVEFIFKFIIANLVFINSLRNIYGFRYFTIHFENRFNFPIIEFFSYFSPIFDILICIISVLICILFFVRKYFFLPILINGFANLYFSFADYNLLHHDVMFSSVLFILLGFYYFKPKRIHIFLVTIYSASSYFAAGIWKLNWDFISGESTIAIMKRSQGLPWDFIYIYLIENFSIKIFTFFAIFIEIFEPFIILYGGYTLGIFSILLFGPFHLGILMTTTATIYNLLYPFAFFFIINSKPNESRSYIFNIGLISLLIFSLFFSFFNIYKFINYFFDKIQIF
jgi:hypothetical protein